MNNNPKLSYIGQWNYAENQSIGCVLFYDLAKFDSTKNYSIVLGGWGFAGWSNTELYKINIAILDQDNSGFFKFNTPNYIDDPSTNGEGSVIVHDFNGDGIDDIFLAAHNESPLKSTASTAYISSSGDFKKIVINDSTQSHSALIGDLNGVTTISTAGYGEKDPFYQYNITTSSFDVNYWGNTYSGSLYGSTSLLVDLNNDGKSELVIGDFKTGPGVDFSVTRSANIAIYGLNNGNLSDSPIVQLNPYFNTEKYENMGLSSEFGASLTHTYRVWSDDFNNDGLQDLMFGVGVWSAAAGTQRAKLQMFQNGGNYNFLDVTDVMGAAYDENSEFVDYSMQMLDIDASGIKSYLLAGGIIASESQQSNYLLVNDGTGRLHSALHKEFSSWSTGTFIPNVRSDGKINYLIAQQSQNQIYLSNFDLLYDVTKDFVTKIEVLDRNQSQLIRTFAGDDVINDQNRSDQATNINGGSGSDSVIYSGLRSNYTVLQVASGYSVQNKLASSASDLLVNIEKIQFVDKTTLIGDSIAGTAGQAYRIYRAAFDRDPMIGDTAGLGYWIAQMDAGMSMTEVAARFIDSTEFRSLYGTAPTNGEFLTKVYNNVLDRDPYSDGYAWWMDQLANNPEKTWQKVLADFSESAENQANVAGLIGNGITYDAWTG